MKRLLCVLSSALFVFAGFLATASGQDQSNSTPVARAVNGGVLNGKATSLPKPEYPEAARQAKIGGSVMVNVTIDESGLVTHAEAQMFEKRAVTTNEGTKLEEVLVDPSLRAAAERAAFEARFSPTRISGTPVQVKGTIVYNFAPETEKLTRISSGGVVSVNSGDGTSASTGAVSTRMTGGDGAISGGVMNGRAKSLAKPAYPPAAMAVNAEGAVSVDVIIDENGEVVAAAAVSGHPLLRAAAEDAARKSTFNPTFLSGNPVKVRGIVTYNFVSGKKTEPTNQ